jgi:hypothetical protein
MIGCAATVTPFDHADHVLAVVFDQAFFQKGCDATVAPFDHANRVWDKNLKIKHCPVFA